MRDPIRRAMPLRVRHSSAQTAERWVPEEVPIALVFDGSTHAVMMASPTDLEDFLIGFAITEGIIASAADIRDIEIVDQGALGIECRGWLTPDLARDMTTRRRRLAGPTGCGLCGIESLEGATPAPPPVTTSATFSADEIMAAMDALGAGQELNAKVRALHAAGFWSPALGLEHPQIRLNQPDRKAAAQAFESGAISYRPDGSIRGRSALVAVMEDVGRHNALDKLIGHLHRLGIDAASGVIVLTSRVSVEMVQKAAASGAGVLAAVSAPTALAIETATQAGLTLVAIARADGFEIFTAPERIRVTADQLIQGT